MMEAPRIFDRSLQRCRLARALHNGFGDFLLDRVVEDLIDRLSTVNRRFDSALDFGTPTRMLADQLENSAITAQVFRAAPIKRTAKPGDLVIDEEKLPFARARFDLAVSALSLHHANDLPGVLVQIRHALKADGLFLAAFLGGETLTELRQAMTLAEMECEGGISPRVAPFADLRDLGSLLQRAGFALPVVDVDRITVRYSDPIKLMHDLRSMGMTNTLCERSRKPLRRETLMRACASYIERFAAPDGRLKATFDVLWLSGWAPHESQQKPLQPGTAKISLTNILPDRSAS